MAIQRDDAYPLLPELEQQITNKVRTWLTQIAEGICPWCGHHIIVRRQHGADVYAFPCQHRLYQGNADMLPQSV